MKKLIHLFTFYLVMNFIYASINAQTPSANSPSNLLLILDASGSMWGQIEGQNKIVIARQVLKDLLGALPENTQVGLVAYGHRSKDDCEDIETIVPLGPLDTAGLSQKIETLNPKGKTPITVSVLKALEIVRAREEATTIVLVSDGLETCSGDPCKVVDEARKAEVNFVMHVIGFDIGEGDVSQLECTAQAGDGLYFSAKNADELAAALDQSVAAPAELPGGKLSIKAMAHGKLEDVVVLVYNAEGGNEVARGRTYSKLETNPRIVSLPAGKYNVEMRAIRIKGNVKQILKEIEIANDETIEKVVDFSTGELAINVTRNGALSDATIKVFVAGTSERITGGRTYRREKTNPAVYRLTPGSYDVVLESVEISGSLETRFDGVVVESSKRVERAHEFVSGTLKISTVQGSELVDAVVQVREIGNGQQVAQSRTYTKSSSNPRTFELAPGKYRVHIGTVKLEGKPKKEIEVAVIAGQVVEESVDFGK